MDDDITRQYVEKAQKGDRAAFENLLSIFSSGLRKYILSRRLSESESEDIFLDVWCKVNAGLKGFTYHSTFFTWLCSITNTTISDATALKFVKDASFELVADLPQILLDVIFLEAQQDPPLPPKEIAWMLKISESDLREQIFESLFDFVCLHKEKIAAKAICDDSWIAIARKRKRQSIEKKSAFFKGFYEAVLDRMGKIVITESLSDSIDTQGHYDTARVAIGNIFVEETLSQLTDCQRKAIIGNMEGYSNSEIASKMTNKNVGNVKSYLHEGRVTTMKKMEKDNE